MRTLRFGLLALAFSPIAVACVTSEVTPLGTTYPSKQPGCTVDVFPATKPPYPYEDVASSRAKCHYTQGRTACIDQLREDACQAGGDAVYAFAEGEMNGYTMISATIGRKTNEASAEMTAPAKKEAPADGCAPPCSPGFACRDAVCQPLCNPACEAGETCTRKRVCEPTPHSAAE